MSYNNDMWRLQRKPTRTCWSCFPKRIKKYGYVKNLVWQLYVIVKEICKLDGWNVAHYDDSIATHTFFGNKF